MPYLCGMNNANNNTMKTLTLQNLNSFKIKGTKTYVIAQNTFEIFQREDADWGVNFFESGELVDVIYGEMLLRECKEMIVAVVNQNS